MGMFSKQVVCPQCGKEAVKSLFKIKCSTYGCPNYSDDVILSGVVATTEPKQQTQTFQSKPRTSTKPKIKTADALTGPPDPITITYKNFRGEQKTFRGDKRTLVKKGQHITLCVEPSNKRIALAQKRIVSMG